MPDEIDAALTRLVATAVEEAPAPPTVEDIATVVIPTAPERGWARPVLAVAAATVLLVAGAVVVTRRHDTTVSATTTPLPGYLLPTWPPFLRLLSARESADGATMTAPTIHVFQRVNSDPNEHQQIVVELGADVGPVGEWSETGDGAGMLTFRVGAAAAVAYTRSAVPEADVRAFAAGLRLNGPSAASGLDPDSGGDFATVAVIPGGDTVPVPPSSEVVWSTGAGTLTLRLTRPPSGIDSTLALPALGIVHRINDREYLDCNEEDVRNVNWLDPSGTWVMLTADGPIDLDQVITSTHPVSVAEWRRATGLSA
jgi:hypothetical protein